MINIITGTSGEVRRLRFSDILAICYELDENSSATDSLHKDIEKRNKLEFMKKKEAERQRYERYKDELKRKKEREKQQKIKQEISKVESSL